MLKIVAKRAQSAVRDLDTVARLGGDEFTIILLELNDVKEGELICQRILDALKPDIQLRDHIHQVGASLGLTVSHGDSETVDDIIRKADLAVYDAKDAGKICCKVYRKSDSTA